MYDWLKAKVHGFNITDQETAAARCCGQIDGKLFVTMKPLGNDDLTAIAAAFGSAFRDWLRSSGTNAGMPMGLAT